MEDMNIQAVDVEEVQLDMSRGLYVAANAKKRWSEEELAMVDVTIQRVEAYKKYLQLCRR